MSHTIVSTASTDGLGNVPYCRMCLAQSNKESNVDWSHLNSALGSLGMAKRPWRLYWDVNRHSRGLNMEFEVHHRRTIGSSHRQRSIQERGATVVPKRWLGVLHYFGTHEKLKQKGARLDPVVDQSWSPQIGSSKIWGGERRTKESPRDAKENVTMCVTKERGQKPTHISLEEQVAGDVKNSAKFTVTNVECD